MQYKNMNIQEQIIIIDELMHKITHSYGVINEKTSTGSSEMNLAKDCPASVRERLQIAADTAQMNEKNLRARQEAMKFQIGAVEKQGDTDGALKLRTDFDKIGSERKQNLQNMDRLESITSDYALKHKPENDKYEQRAHAMFLQKQRAKMEDRLKKEEEAGFPNPDTIEKLQRRLSRVEGAQKESDKWFSDNDSKWIKAHKESRIDPKELVARHKSRIKTERDVVLTAKKEIAKAVEKGEIPPVTTQQAAVMAGDEQKTNGSVWKTSNGQYGAINRGGVQKYFGSEEEAKVYAELEKGIRRSGEKRKRKTAVSAETKATSEPTAQKIVQQKMVNAGDLAAEIVGKHLKTLSEGTNMIEEVSMEEMKQGIEQCLATIEKHKKLAFEAKKSGDTKEYQRCRNIIGEASADIKTIQDMIKRALHTITVKETVSFIIKNSIGKKANK